VEQAATRPGKRALTWSGVNAAANGPQKEWDGARYCRLSNPQVLPRLQGADGRARFVQADLLDLSLARLRFDAPVEAVLSTATFHWVTDHDRLFANLYSMLRPAGQLVAQCGADRAA